MINFYIGLNDKDTHKQEYKTNDLINSIVDIFNSHNITGLTITQAIGVYNGERENSLVVSIIDRISEIEIIYICNDIKLELNQECVMVQKIQDEIKGV